MAAAGFAIFYISRMLYMSDVSRFFSSLEIYNSYPFLFDILFGFLFNFLFDVSFCLSAVLFIVSGSEACRYIARYGIGTGVPSVGMYSVGIATICSVFGFSLFDQITGFGGFLAGISVSLIFGFICGKITNKYLNLNIPGFTYNMTLVSVATTASFMASGIFLFGSFESIIYLRGMIMSGIAALLFIGTAVMVFHSYNASLGADESHDRTQHLAFSNAFLWMLLLSLISAFFKPVSVVLIIMFSLILFIYSFKKYVKCVKRDSYVISEPALLPTEEELI